MLNAAAVIPTYNERENIGQLLERIYACVPDLHVWIVDDNSPDGTGNYAEQLRSQYPGRLFVIHRERKTGFGQACIEGFSRTLAAGYDYILQMDADLSHDPQCIPGFLKEVRSCDLVIGSRYVGGIRIMGWALWRLILSSAGTWYVRRVTGMRLTDTTTGYLCWRALALKVIGIDRLFSNGYLFLVELKYKAFRQGLRIREIPIVFYERRFGRSKLDWNIVLEALVGVFRLRLTR
ncbi:MAG: hypothetical protein A3D28_01980 [Omnitrophica bacterium RIFCSPHIGHO2_02_FULL_63_14]|nr:MAG: hypothetical protein A3D28_01980 [Omnitrophica bacterium RIFCSPHIGHO2_02_FULL_63_14]